MGHLDTDGLDPVTAEVVQVLAAADLVAAEQRATHPTEPGPRWRQAPYVVGILVSLCMVLLSLGYLKVSEAVNAVRENTSGSTQARTQLKTLGEENKQLAEQIRSCVVPEGECAKRGAESQAAAIEQIVNQLTINACRIANPDNATAAARCVVIATNGRP